MKLFITIILLVLSSCFISIHPENPKETENLLILTEKQKSKRPRMPSKRILICNYQSGLLTFSFQDVCQSLSYMIYDESQCIWSGYITSSNTSCEIPVLEGKYTLECVTDQNQIFTGTLYF